jgi:hypothetical protein
MKVAVSSAWPVGTDLRELLVIRADAGQFGFRVPAVVGAILCPLSHRLTDYHENVSACGRDADGPPWVVCLLKHTAD